MDTYTARSMLLNESRQQARVIAEPWGPPALPPTADAVEAPQEARQEGWMPTLLGTLRRFWH